MCLECDGYSHEEVMQAFDLRIRVNGWALVQVQDDHTAWCYTVGLLEHFGHPELTMVDVELEEGAKVITHLVEGISTRGKLPTDVRRLGLEIVEVHRDHLWGDLFGTWSNRYDRPLMPGEMLQVVLPAGAYCECHAHVARRLDRAEPLAPPRPPNREERRRRGRRGHAA